MCSEEIKNVFVLATTTFRFSRFCKFFEAYLSYDSLKEAQRELNVFKDNEMKSFVVSNVRLIFTPYLENSHVSNQIISMLSNFEENQSISAIMIFINPSKKNRINFGELRRQSFCYLKNISDNILYVNNVHGPRPDPGCGAKEKKNDVHENDLCKYEKILREQYDMIRENVFIFNESTFFEVPTENWSYGVNFCKNIMNSIIGNGNNCGLETIYINSKMSDELLLNLINNLTELLILIYTITYIQLLYQANKEDTQRTYICQFRRDNTVCYGATSKQPSLVKIPETCHVLCDCRGTNINVAKCIIFDAANETCKKCKCKTEHHSRNKFKFSNSGQADIKQASQEKEIVINILATFYIFKNQNQEVLSSEDIFNKYLDLKVAYKKKIFDVYGKELKQKVEELQRTSQSITNKDVAVCINNLYEIKETATIIPKFLEEIFPTDFQFEIQENPSRKKNKKAKPTTSKRPAGGVKKQLKENPSSAPNKKAKTTKSKGPRGGDKTQLKKSGNPLRIEISNNTGVIAELEHDFNSQL